MTAATIRRLLALLCAVLLSACGPSCEELGGKIEFSHFVMIYQPALKMMQPIAQYKCVMPEEQK